MPAPNKSKIYHSINKNRIVYDAKEKVYSDFREGGLNLAASPWFTTEKDIIGGKNFCYERTGGRIRSLEPLKKIATVDGIIDSMYYSKNYGIFFTKQGLSVRRIAILDPVTHEITQDDSYELNGQEIPQYTEYGESTDRRVFFASGGILSYWGKDHRSTPVGTTPGYYSQNPVNITEEGMIGQYWNSGSDIVVREGRIGICMGLDNGQDFASDTLKFSGVGDPENWQMSDNGEEDPWTTADGMYTEVGYKEGGNILRMLQVSKSIVVFRTDGSLFRFSGEWVANYSTSIESTETTSTVAIEKVGSDVELVCREAAANVGNDVYFIDKDRGLRKVSTVYENSDLAIAVREAEGEKIDSYIAEHCDEGARMWVLNDRGEIWVKPSSLETKIFCLNTRYKGWTVIDLGLQVTSVCEAEGVVYIAIGTDIYILGDDQIEPEIIPTMELELSPVFSDDRVCCSFNQVRASISSGANATIKLGRHTHTIKDGRTNNYQVVVEKEITPKITCSGGKFVLDNVSLTYSEVV